MSWSAEYQRRMAAVGEQHRWVARMCEDYRLALNAGQGERTYRLLLEMLESFVRMHLEYEDALLECPCAAERQTRRTKENAVFEGILQFETRYLQNGFSELDAHELLDTVESWLSQHCARLDVDLTAGVPPGVHAVAVLTYAQSELRH